MYRGGGSVFRLYSFIFRFGNIPLIFVPVYGVAELFIVYICGTF